MRLTWLSKSLIVLVIFASIFSSYCYVRLIQPYIDVGGIVYSVPSDLFYRESVIINGDNYSYWTNGVRDPEKIVVMLPPSTATGEYFGRYSEVFGPNILVISPDYPGRGLTTKIEEFDTVPRLASKISVLLQEVLGQKKFILVGPSFGGMIATQLVREPDLNIEKVILIATGEFFAKDQKSLYSLIFYPGTFSEKFLNNYVEIIHKTQIFDNLEYLSVEDMLEQWLTTLDYKIDTSVGINTPAVLIAFTEDNVIREGSIEKLEKLFSNRKTYYLNLTHTTDSFFSDLLKEVITSNI